MHTKTRKRALARCFSDVWPVYIKRILSCLPAATARGSTARSVEVFLNPMALPGKFGVDLRRSVGNSPELLVGVIER